MTFLKGLLAQVGKMLLDYLVQKLVPIIKKHFAKLEKLKKVKKRAKDSVKPLEKVAKGEIKDGDKIDDAIDDAFR